MARSGQNGYTGQYIAGTAANAGMQLLEGTDVGTFVNTMRDTGNIWMALGNTLTNAFAKVLGSSEKLEEALNPITEILMGLKPALSALNDYIVEFIHFAIDLFQPLFDVIGQIIESFRPLVDLVKMIFLPMKMLAEIFEPLLAAFHDVADIVFEVANILNKMAFAIDPVFLLIKGFGEVMKLFKPILDMFQKGLNGAKDSLGWFSELLDNWLGLSKEKSAEEEEELERLKAVNDQYKNLYAALKEQEEYYLQQRRHLNAEWAIENYRATPVHDMILSPHGAFSTDPNDFIIATKDPKSLGGGAAVNVIVNNYANNTTVERHETTRGDGGMDIVIAVKNIVAKELASGGFDGPMDAMKQRRYGRVTT